MPGPITLIKESVAAFIEDDALSRGASIAFYAVTSLAPILVIVVAIAGLAFGEDAARGALATQLRGLMGRDSADLLQSAVATASSKQTGTLASVLGILALVVTASGVFGEMQSALNAIWKASPRGTTMSRLLRARVVSLGLVAALGFLLLVSLAISAGLSALGDYLDARMPFNVALLQTLNFIISFLLISILFAAIYKVLPDTPIDWRDVLVGAVVTAFLFEVGKFLIGFYLGNIAATSAYGAAGALLIAMLWTYYSAQIFLLGAEFTKVFSLHRHPAKASSPAQAPDRRRGGDTRANRIEIGPIGGREACIVDGARGLPPHPDPLPRAEREKKGAL
jgi:membrane protein